MAASAPRGGARSPGQDRKIHHLHREDEGCDQARQRNGALIEFVAGLAGEMSAPAAAMMPNSTDVGVDDAVAHARVAD